MRSHYNILHFFASDTWGGGEQYVFDLTKKQLDDGYKVVLISSASCSFSQKISLLNCRNFTLRHRWHFNPISIFKTWKIISQENINIIHTHQFRDAFIAVLASALFKKNKRPKVIMTRHLVRQGKSNILYQWLYSHLEKIIFVSETAKQAFLKKIQISKDKITVIHNSILPKATRQQTNYREKLSLSNDCLVVGFIGSIAEYKGVELLLNVADKFQDKKIVFLLAGSGNTEYIKHISQQISEKGLSEKFFLLGFVHYTGDFISQMDICVFPSLCVESFGLVLLECMQQGVPLIASNTGAQSEIIENEINGFLVVPAEEDIYNAIMILYGNENLRQKIGKQAKINFNEKFAYPIFYEKIMRLYTEILTT